MSLSPRHWPRAALTLGRTFGVRGAALRAVHELRRAAGAFRPAPAVLPAAAGSPLPFGVSREALAGASDAGEAVRRADRVVAGEYQAYRSAWRRLPSAPGEWTSNPLTGWSYDSSAPWWSVESLNPAAGDIKDLWEPARFSWAYDLVRAHVLTGQARYAEALYRYVGEWLASSPPFQGPHWHCGQEVAIRATALLFAEASVGEGAGTAADRSRLLSLLAASGERIDDALGLSISMRNNHAISEAVGLVLLGARLRGQHPDADRWLRRGRRWLERLVTEQFAPDGWYIQHSFNYTRLALDQCVLGQRVLRGTGRGLAESAVERLRAAVELLGALVDPATGAVPNHGASDGAFVAPFTLAPYRDYRSTLTAVCASFGIPLPAGMEPDGEALAWLGLDPPPTGPAPGDAVWKGPSGWASARIGPAVAFLRAGRYRSRPGHLDPLHLDLRFGSAEVVVDPGTFAYNAPPPWRNSLSAAAVHNGVVLDGREPGIRGPRFLWYAWPEAELLDARRDGQGALLVAQVPGQVRREVRIGRDEVVVEDTLLTAADEAVIRWLLHPDADPRVASVEGGATLREGAEGDPAGWFSPAYGERIRARYLEVRRPVAPGDRIVSRFRDPRSR